MKKFVLILLSALFVITGFAQEVSKKEARQAKREAEKKEAHEKYLKAVQLMKDKTFIVTAQTITFRSGQQIFPDESINFLKVNEGKGVIQIAPRTAMNPGFNGLGGITIEGDLSNVKESENKKKNHYTMSFTINGLAGTAQITVNLYGSDQASVMVQGMYSGVSFTLNGILEAVGDATIYQGSDY